MELNRSTGVLAHISAAMLLVVGVLMPFATQASAANTISQTFNYTGGTQSFTVPAGVSALTVTLTGGQGGLGGGDSQGSPTPGGYRGVVTGTIDVTPGQVLTLAVGGGGGTGVSSSGSAAGGSAGLNPLAGYDGAVGGVAGPAGSSGGGGGSGAATVLRTGATDLVAAGAGGNGGNGQFSAIVGRRAEENHQPRSDATSTSGRAGMNTALACSPGFRCDGGASGAGGGGAQGGEQGDIQYGGDTATEYFGFGGYPGANSIAGMAGLSSFYEYYAGNSANGSITISYDDGAPGAPRSVSGIPASGRVDLTWLAPATSGSAPITDYVVKYATSANGTYTTFADGVSNQPSASVTGLVNGTTYWFRVAAVNAVATGADSATMAQGVMASDVPSAPTINSVDPLDGGLRAHVSAGTTHSPVVGWEFSLDGGAWQAATHSGSELTLAGLRNGTEYAIRVRARNAVGASDPSSQVSATPRAVPGAPDALVATPSAGAVALAWNPPGSDNGSAITDYVVQRSTSTGGPWTTVSDGVGTTTATVVTGLTNGTDYLFRISAVNAAGTGQSSAVASATPFTTPDTPIISAASPADGSLAIDLATTSDGGSDLIRYEYRLDGAGPWTSAGSAVEPFVVSGLSNGVLYGVEVRAVNAAGASPASSSASATPVAVPAAPAISAVALDTGAVQVSFSLGSDGGSSITNLQYSIDGGDTWVTRSPAGLASPLTISGLVGGQTYPVRLRALNAQGPGAASNTSSVTAKGTPEAPTIGAVTAGDRNLLVVVIAGPNGGSPITNYEYSIDNGASWATRSPSSQSSPILITGLANGANYQVRVRAVNAAGSGASSSSQSATPRTVPSAPTIDSDTVGGAGGEIDVDFSPPADDGGSPVSTYQYSTDGGATWRSRATGSTSSPLRITTMSADGITPLVGGQIYPVEIRAVNAAGAGAASAVADGITTTAPGAPRIDGVDVAGSTARVTFEPPANGGAAITGYQYSLDGGAWTSTGTLAPEVRISALSQRTYQFRVRALNEVGPGDGSAAVPVVVRASPDAPDVTGVEVGDGHLSVTFNPGNDGGDPITGYQFSTDGGVTWRTRTTGTTASPLAIGSDSTSGAALVNGRLYAVQIRALNAAGAGAASQSTLIAPLGTPEAPVGLGLSGTDRSLIVGFTSGGDGGSAITRIEYSLDGGSWVDSGSLSSTFTVGGLINGEEYEVRVRAVNALGAGDEAGPVRGTPQTLPGAPLSLSAVAGDGSATVSWSAPASDGGSPVVGYVATLYDQSAAGIAVASCSTSGQTTCVVGGLDNGTTLYAAAVAITSAGTGPSTTPRLAVRPVGVPTVAITSLTPAASSIQVDVSTDDGGAPLSGYQYRLDGGSWVSAETTAEPFTISGLTTGQSYDVEVRAVNSVGVGPASAPAAATPRTAPGGVSALSATGLDSSASLQWAPPANDGGDPVSDYVVEFATSPSGPWTTFADGATANNSAVVTGLTNGTSYLFRVSARNDAGSGPVSSLASATPLGVPSAPNLTGLTTGSQYMQASFTAPGSNGGTPITGYQYQLNGGDWRNVAGTTSPLMIAGLDNGQDYAVAIRAVNAVGGGAASNSRSGRPFGRPAGVEGFIASPSANSVALSWDAVNDNGSPVTAYNIIRWSARTEGSIVGSYQTTGTSYTVTGLSSGTTYYFTIEATNAAGTGPRSAPRASAVTGAAVPAAPSFDSVVTSGGQTHLSWTAGAAGSHAIGGFLVQYEQASTRMTMVNSASPGTSASLTLPPGADDYSLRVAMVSAAGVGQWASVSPPSVTTGVVSGISASSATIAGVVDARGQSSEIGFEYAEHAADLGTPAAALVAATPSTVASSGDTATAAELDGLSAGTTYFARAVATRGVVRALGDVVSFTTPASVTTRGLSKVYDGEPAELETSVEPAGLSVVRSFVGISGTTYGPSSTPPTAAGSYRVTTSVIDEGVSGSEVATLHIARRSLTLDAHPIPRSYDGTTAVDLDLALTGAVDGDDVAIIDGAVTGALRDPGAGDDRMVDITAATSLLAGEDAGNYTVTVPSSASVDISRADQRLEFRTVAPTPFIVGRTYSPVVESSAELVPELSVVSDPDDGNGSACELVGGAVTALEAGTCVIVAIQQGNDDVGPARSAGQFVRVVAVPAQNPGAEPGQEPGAPSTPPRGAPEAGRAAPQPSSQAVIVPLFRSGPESTPLPSGADRLITVEGGTGSLGTPVPGGSDAGTSGNDSGRGPVGQRPADGPRERLLGEPVAEERSASASGDGPVAGLIAAVGANPEASLALVVLLGGAALLLSRQNRWLAMRRRSDDERD